MGSIPGLLKAYYNVNEILSTIMLNIVAIQIMNALLRGPMIDPAQDGVLNNIPQTRRLPNTTDLPIIIPGTSINLGLLVAIARRVRRRSSCCGAPRSASGCVPLGSAETRPRYSGMPVARNVTLALSLSGAFCGLAGAVLVFGSDSHRFFTDGSASGFTGSAGFNGIIAALFGGVASALLTAGLGPVRWRSSWGPTSCSETPKCPQHSSPR